MRYDPLITFPENCHFLPEEIYVMQFVRQNKYRRGKMRRCFLEINGKDFIMPLFSDKNDSLFGKYLNIGNGEIYDDFDACNHIFDEEVIANLNYDIYVADIPKQTLADIIGSKEPMNYCEMEHAYYEAIDNDKDGYLIDKVSIRIPDKELDYYTEIEFSQTELPKIEGKYVLKREQLVAGIKEEVLLLKRMEKNRHYHIQKLYIGYHQPQNQYQQSLGLMFLVPCGKNVMNVLDEEVYEISDFSMIQKYTDYIKEHNLEVCYPIYDSRMCFEQSKQLKKIK